MTVFIEIPVLSLMQTVYTLWDIIGLNIIATNVWSVVCSRSCQCLLLEISLTNFCKRKYTNEDIQQISQLRRKTLLGHQKENLGTNNDKTNATYETTHTMLTWSQNIRKPETAERWGPTTDIVYQSPTFWNRIWRELSLNLMTDLPILMIYYSFA